MKLVSWNLEGRLSDLSTDGRGTPEKIVEAIRELDADVLVHPEAFGSEPAVRAEITQALEQLGYASVSTEYDDLLDRPGKAVVSHPSIMVLSRLPIKNHEIIRPGNLRNMLSVTITDPKSGKDIRIIAVHLEDREEALRMKQVAPLIDIINAGDQPTIVCGDFNAMPPRTFKSDLIHSGLVRDLATLIPHAHMRYTVKRLSDMASGTTIEALLKQTNLRNTDPRLRPTTTPKMRRMEWLPSWRLAKIDWILVSPDISFTDFTVSRDFGSDHRALSLQISLET